MTALLSSYQLLVSKSPLLTNCIAGGLIAAVGDVLCQRYFEYPKLLKLKLDESNFHHTSSNPFDTHTFDYKLESIEDGDEGNTLRNRAPPIRSSNQELRQLYPFHWNKTRTIEMGLIRAVVVTPYVLAWYPFLASLCPGQQVIRVATRIAIDQLISSPIIITLVYLSHATIHRYSWQHFLLQMKSEFLPAWKSGLQYWPFVHIITYGMLPLTYQPLFAHFASVYWNGVLSYYANLSKASKE